MDEIKTRSMKYWKEATLEEYEAASTKAMTVDGHLFVLINPGDVIEIIKDLLAEIK